MRILFTAFLLSTPALAQADQPQVATQASAPAEKPVCRRIEPKTGSHVLSKRVCRSAAEWAQIDDAARRDRNNAVSEMNQGYRSGVLGN